jgi:hypothetical protein
MEPSSIHIAEKLLNIGGTAGVLYVAIYYLVRTLKSQYDDRILTLEKRSDKCEEDRKSLHQEIRAMQSEQLRLIERIAKVD